MTGEQKGCLVMDMMEAIEQRHSVRAFKDDPIEGDVLQKLDREIAACNQEGSLNMVLVTDEPKAFDSTLAHYGRFSNVRNYIIVAGDDAPDLDFRAGYYGERVVLLAQQLGLNTCWVALTFKKRLVKKTLKKGERLVLVIAIGYGEDGGKERKSKKVTDVIYVPAGEVPPDWFIHGVEAALLAPTAVNQQKFMIDLTDTTSQDGKRVVQLLSKGGAYSDIDMGIVRLHFEIGAGTDNFEWAMKL